MTSYAVRFGADDTEEILCPELDRQIVIGSAEAENVLRKKHRTLSESGECICFDCYLLYGEKLTVRIKAGDSKAWHYAHLPGFSKEKHDRAESAHAGATPAHRSGVGHVWQKLIKDAPDSSLQLEVTTRRGQLNRRPDLVQTLPSGAKHAHEIQFSRIPLNRLKARTEDLLKLGYDTVTWYLFSAAYTNENRDYLSDVEKVKFFKMTAHANESADSLPLIQTTLGTAYTKTKKSGAEESSFLLPNINRCKREDCAPFEREEAPRPASVKLAPLPAPPQRSNPKNQLSSLIGQVFQDKAQPWQVEVVSVENETYRLLAVVQVGTSYPLYTRCAKDLLPAA